MKAKERKLIKLSVLGSKLEEIKRQSDHKVSFQLQHTAFIILSLFNINLSLFGTSYFNYNYSLMIYNSLFLSRKAIQSIYTYYSIRSTSASNLNKAPLNILMSVYILIITHCLTSLFFSHSLNSLLNLICPFTAYQFLAHSTNSSRYSEGSTDCFYSLQQISLNSLEILYCAGYLPYKFFPSSGFQMNFSLFFNSFLAMFICDNVLNFGEFFKKRSAELMFFAHSQGEWRRTEEIATEEWQTDKRYNKGEVVKHKGSCWKGVGKFNNCEPGKYETFVLMFLFKDPIRTLKMFNVLTCGYIVLHNIYMIYMPFHYSQVVSITIFTIILIRNLAICSNLQLPNI